MAARDRPDLASLLVDQIEHGDRLGAGHSSGGWSTRDLPWTEMAFQNKAYPLRVEVGRLDRYLDAPAAHTGPAVDSIPQGVRDDAEDFAIVALRPSDFQCHTPL